MLRHLLTLPLIFAIALPIGVSAAPWPAFSTRGTQFIRDGRPYQLISGAIHFQRIPRAYWKDRLQKARAMGLNTVETYVFWNLVELREGQFDFTGNNDIGAFVREAASQGLNVILRPGPYVCAEWEAGGFPAWLFADPTLRVRSQDPRFLDASQRYLEALGTQVRPLLNGNGGPIIAVQVENEYGSYGDDHGYLQAVRALFIKAGLGGALLFTADGAQMLGNGTLPDVLAAVNVAPGEAKQALDKLATFHPGQPQLVGEYWAGWFDQWGKPHAQTDAKQQADEIEWMLRQGHSINLYMFVGGTSFGFMNGANFQGGPGDHYSPQTTSYDYDAALDEAGRPMPKFALFRDVITGVTGLQPPPLPAATRFIDLPDTPLRASASLWDNLPAAVATSADPQPMERYGQAYGYILYRTTIHGPRKGRLYLGEVRDDAHVYVDRLFVGRAERRRQQVWVEVDIPSGTHRLDVLVENSGRVNYGPHLADGRAGLIGPVMLNHERVNNWETFLLPLQTPEAIHGWTTAPMQGPAFHRGTLFIRTPGDTFLDMEAFSKGVTWANGHMLGRYWDIGPQRALYFPGAWQRQGENTVLVFDVSDTAAAQVRGVQQQRWITPRTAK
ncbi:glycoside hydrolase family 35 protein [Xylella fastidiosa]|uniref:glycoside hydrolase family 35 protein n=1 Tax=Xylella fastidiosa TaxID=2371 RepID=UPI001194E894|nr:glycoside hydrolase family 35 protein [Xylella fastidiosa]MBS9445753.1 beta-galactosidase [Xylella fastidiosa subsp. multiplex]MBS9447700.1 beta-galactosidase [Xylella fastidiosa subsp. multiplex]MBS9449771.1 beta-galactosidase [Xylella fastidiosa subsp. multiplex]MBS9451658.1 beta-galactosidase [Xylella fastidiosa subsp. multiplex]MBS9485930.1 beta-galactosidase [Xylella fastidiosa subsp. multiplex]